MLRGMHVMVRRIEILFRFQPPARAGGGAGRRRLSASAGAGFGSSEVSMPGSMFILVSRLCASSSSWSRNWRAMARARPTHLPTCWASLGSFSGPSTMSASAKISSSSVNPTSNMGMLRGAAVVR